MNKTVKWILAGVGVLAVAIVLVTVFGDKSSDYLKVTTEQVKRMSIVETVSATGKIFPENEVPLSPDISGEITELNVKEGDSVRKGQVLARVFADIYSSQRDEAAARVAQAQATIANSQASLNALKAQLDQDRISYERNRKLFDEQVISRSELEIAETRYRSSQANYNAALQNIRSLQAGAQGSRSTLEMANKNLGRTTIVAPMDGVVTQLNVEKGQKVVGTGQMAGTQMMIVSDVRIMELQVLVGENDVVKVKTGDSADISVEAYNNRKFKGVVTRISASNVAAAGSANAAGANDVTNYMVFIRIDPASYADLLSPSRPTQTIFRPGMNASADIKTNRKDGVLAVPSGAVASRAKGSGETMEETKKKREKSNVNGDEAAAASLSDDMEVVVFVLNADGTVSKRQVATGIQNITYMEITSGLKEGDQVVTAPYTAVSKTLRDGRKVTVVPKEKLFDEK